jgi:lysine biosynthesis protein LysW
MAHCPECEALLDVEEDDVEEGDIINCAECGLELEIVNQSPLEVERVEEEESDEDGDEGGFDDDGDDFEDEPAGEDER